LEKNYLFSLKQKEIKTVWSKCRRYVIDACLQMVLSAATAVKQHATWSALGSLNRLRTQKVPLAQNFTEQVP